jgi:hypothetical protein
VRDVLLSHLMNMLTMRTIRIPSPSGPNSQKGFLTGVSQPTTIIGGLPWIAGIRRAKCSSVDQSLTKGVCRVSQGQLIDISEANMRVGS